MFFVQALKPPDGEIVLLVNNSLSDTHCSTPPFFGSVSHPYSLKFGSSILGRYRIRAPIQALKPPEGEIVLLVNSRCCGSRVLVTKNWKKITAEKKINYFFVKLQFTYPRTSKLQKKPSALYLKAQNVKFLNFFYLHGSFLSSGIRIRIRIHWPDWIRIQNTAFQKSLLFVVEMF